MRKTAFAFLGLVAFVALVIGGLMGWMLVFRPLMRPLTSRHFDASPQRLERGRYLVQNLALCIRCHSPNEMRTPPLGAEGSGWVLPAPHNGPFRHQIVASNITPDADTGIGRWSDDEIGRAIREGVSRDGRSLTYAMPCGEYRKMSDEDLASVVVYLRSLPPVRRAMPKTNLVFPVTLLVRLVPLPVTSPVTPGQAPPEMRGAYLAALATCNSCHSPHDFSGHPLEGLEFSGGDVLRFGSAPATASNLTPDATGLEHTTRESFRAMMRNGQSGGRMLHPLMPYEQYARLTDADLDDLFAFLRSVKPVKHFVNAAELATLCRLCKNQHGGGNRN